MATPKTETQVHQHTITATLTDEEYEILEMFAAEEGIENLSDAVPAILHELVSLHDALWDAQFALSTKPLDDMAKQAHEDYLAGLTEEFDPNSDAP